MTVKHTKPYNKNRNGASLPWLQSIPGYLHAIKMLNPEFHFVHKGIYGLLSCNKSSVLFMCNVHVIFKWCLLYIFVGHVNPFLWCFDYQQSKQVKTRHHKGMPAINFTVTDTKIYFMLCNLIVWLYHCIFKTIQQSISLWIKVQHEK